MRDSERNRMEALEEEEVQLEKHDMLALSLAGFLTIGLPCLVLVLIITAVVLLLFS